MKEPDFASRVMGCLLGGAIGDAFGYEIEFDSMARIRERFGPKGLTEPVRHGGKLITSDDTQMTLFTLEGLLRARAAGCLGDMDATLEHLRLATLDWYKTQSAQPGRQQYTGRLGRSPVMQVRRAPGNTCLSACARGATGTIEKPINDSKGCGGVMRVAPIGLMRELTVEQAFELGARAAAQTHGHPAGYLTEGFLAAMIRLLLDGASCSDAGKYPVDGRWNHMDEIQKFMARVPRTCSAASNSTQPLPELIRGALGEGWVAEEALAIGCFAVEHAGDVEEAIRVAANHGGDSDSTASIAGQIAGAAFGVAAIPQAWREGLECDTELSELANRLL